MIGTSELILIFLVVLLFFGAARLPALARSMGQAFKEFKKAKDGIVEDIQQEEKKEAEKDDGAARK